MNDCLTQKGMIDVIISFLWPRFNVADDKTLWDGQARFVHIISNTRLVRLNVAFELRHRAIATYPKLQTTIQLLNIKK
jgi:hypothetical protein